MDRHKRWICTSRTPDIRKHDKVITTAYLMFEESYWFKRDGKPSHLEKGVIGFVKGVFANGYTHTVDIITTDGQELCNIPCTAIKQMEETCLK